MSIEKTETGADEEKVRGLFIVGGVVKEVITSSDAEALRNHLSSLLQVKNLVVLLGSGASFHLGSPQTRNLTNESVLKLIEEAGGEPTSTDGTLLQSMNPGDSGDLEKLLNGLQLAASLAEQTGQASVTLGEGENSSEYSREEVDGLRARINRAFAKACDLPRSQSNLEEPYKSDPLLAHRTFLTKMLRNRGRNLSRPRIFTTNYDLVIERSLDELGYPYIDGFSGTVDRRLNLAVYGLDFHRVEMTTQSVLARAESVLYLYKIHGSLNWRSIPELDRLTGLQTMEVKQTPILTDDEELVLIYPTSSKEGDTLAYPYSDLLRILGEAVQQDDTAVIVAGYGFADAHINRILLRSLATNSALSFFVADPYAVLESGDLEGISPDVQHKKLKDLVSSLKRTPISALAQSSDSRLAVLTGDCGKFTELVRLMPDSAGVEEAPTAIEALIEALEQAMRGDGSPVEEGDGHE